MDDRRFYEDVETGVRIDLGTYEMTEREIVSFAERWDPLPFHVDGEAARRHGGLIASGHHTLCVTARLAVEGFRRETAVVAGLGIDDLRWHRPVRPGDAVAASLEVIDKRPSESHPEAGVIRESVAATVDGETVLTYEDAALVARREAGGDGPDGDGTRR
ncbi:MAG: MaoC/PaaZ C-terminal domain-containing protein [Haloferacaceae archaeon]